MSEHYVNVRKKNVEKQLLKGFKYHLSGLEGETILLNCNEIIDDYIKAWLFEEYQKLDDIKDFDIKLKFKKKTQKWVNKLLINNLKK